MGWKSIPFTRSERAKSCLCRTPIPSAIWSNPTRCTCSPCRTSMPSANTTASRVGAYLDVESHGVWGMRRMFVWCGVGPARATKRSASRSDSPGRADQTVLGISWVLSRRRRNSRLEDSWRPLRDNVCVHKGFPPRLTAFCATRGTRVSKSLWRSMKLQSDQVWGNNGNPMDLC